MRLALIGCMVLNRDINHCIVQSGNYVHPFWVDQSFHDTPELLKKKLQQTIDEIEEIHVKQKGIKIRNDNGFDAIIFGYGLCSNGVIGLTSKILPLIIPRCDDCIALFLGSQEKYLNIFQNEGGSYWYNKPWMESNNMPSKEYHEQLFKIYAEEYDEDTAQYLIEQETSYINDYKNAYFIRSSIYNDIKESERTKEIAKQFNWEYKEAFSNDLFIKDLINGNWDERFLVCKPNEVVKTEYSGLKIIAE